MTISCASALDRRGDLARVIELAERALLECDRECLQRPVDHAGHQRGNRAAVEAAREEHAERHVGHQPDADRLLEPFAEPLARRSAPDVERDPGARARRHVPVLAHA